MWVPTYGWYMTQKQTVRTRSTGQRARDDDHTAARSEDLHVTENNVTVELN